MPSSPGCTCAPMRRLRHPTGGLWSHPDFLKLWTGQSISEVGSQVSQLAIPWLAAVGLHASPITFSLLGVLGFLPFLLFALLSGGLIAALTAPYAIVADAASFVVSTLFMTRMRHRENIPERAAGESHPKMWPQVREGLAWVLGNRTLRSIAGCTGTSNFFGQI